MGVAITTSSAPMVMVTIMATAINAVKITAVVESGRKIEVLTATPIMATIQMIKTTAAKVSEYSTFSAISSSSRRQILTCNKNSNGLLTNFSFRSILL